MGYKSSLGEVRDTIKSGTKEMMQPCLGYMASLWLRTVLWSTLCLPASRAALLCPRFIPCSPLLCCASNSPPPPGTAMSLRPSGYFGALASALSSLTWHVF